MKPLVTAPKCLFDAIAPLTTLKYFFGLRVFQYPRGKLGIVLSLIYFLLVIGIFGMSVSMQRKFYKNIKLLKLEYILYELMVYTDTFVISVEIILSWFYTKRVNACYRRIAQVDETLRQLGSTFSYGGIYFCTIVVIIIWFIYIIFLNVMSAVYLPASPQTVSWIIMSQIYGISVNFVIISEFSIFVKCLQMKFKLVNELLSEGVAESTTKGIKLGLFTAEDYAKIINAEHNKHIFSTKMLSQVNRQLQSRIRNSITRKRNLARTRTVHLSSQLQKQFQMELRGQSGNQIECTNSIQGSMMILGSPKRKHLLQTIRQVHLELCKISKTLCTSFGMQITSEIGISTMIITGILYNLYIRLIEGRSNFNNSALDQLSVAILITLVYTLKIIFINFFCKKATCEGKKTTEIIHAIYKCCEDVDIREEVQQFGLQISQGLTDFSTFGVSLNYEVIVTCLKTVTTYLVIMIQMGNSLESSKNIQETRN